MLLLQRAMLHKSLKSPARLAKSSFAKGFPFLSSFFFFFFFSILFYREGSCRVRCSSLREACSCPKSRQVVLERAHRQTHTIRVIKTHSKTQLLHPQGHLGTSPEVPHSFCSAFSDTVDTLHVVGPRRRRRPGQLRRRRHTGNRCVL